MIRQKLDDYELGYTPDNLRYFTHEHSLRREDVATLLEVSLSTVHAWCAAPDTKKHRTMPAAQWQRLKAKVQT